MHVVQKAVQNFLSKYDEKSEGFPSVFRLLRENRYDHVLRSKSIVERPFKVFYTENSENNARLGIIVSKRLISRSVDRNSSKRIIREVFRRHQIKRKKLDLVVMLIPSGNPESSIGRDILTSLLTKIEERCTRS